MDAVPELALHEWSALRSELVWVYDQPVAAAALIQNNNRRTGHWAWFLRSGSLLFQHASGSYRVRPGQWFLVPSGGARHEFSPGSRLLSLHFLHQWPSGEPFIRNEKGLAFAGSKIPELERRATRLARLAARHFPSASNYKLQSGQVADGRIFLRLQTYFHAWLESWLDANLRNGISWSRLRSGDDRLLETVRSLNRAPLDQPFPRGEILRASRLGEVHLTRLFLGEFGLSPRKYWDRRRLEFAKHCLESSLMPVKEIAARLGFRSDSHFVVWFRRLTSQRPGAFREKSAALTAQP